MKRDSNEIINNDGLYSYTNSTYVEPMTIQMGTTGANEVCIIVKNERILPTGETVYNEEFTLIPINIYIKFFKLIMAELPLGGALYGEVK